MKILKFTKNKLEGFYFWIFQKNEPFLFWSSIMGLQSSPYYGAGPFLQVPIIVIFIVNFLNIKLVY